MSRPPFDFALEVESQRSPFDPLHALLTDLAEHHQAALEQAVRTVRDYAREYDEDFEGEKADDFNHFANAVDSLITQVHHG